MPARTCVWTTRGSPVWGPMSTTCSVARPVAPTMRKGPAPPLPPRMTARGREVASDTGAESSCGGGGHCTMRLPVAVFKATHVRVDPPAPAKGARPPPSLPSCSSASTESKLLTCEAR